MSKHSSLFLLSWFLLFPSTLLAAEMSSQSKLSEECRSDIRQLKQDASSTAHDIEVLRRDQINYKIEKDLLKDAFSSNLQSINIIITIVFGVFGGLGYLGMRSIKEIKIDYANELENLKKLKIEFETELQTLSNKQKVFEAQVANLGKVNEEQNTRLKVLELIEKTSSLISNKQWQWALHWINAGLEMDPKNAMLLRQKAQCLGAIGDITSTIAARKLLLELDPEDPFSVVNLLEALALGVQSAEFYKYFEKYKATVEEKYDGNLSVYLKVVLELLKGNISDAVKEMEQFATALTNEAKPLLGGWSFNEASFVIERLPAGQQKELLFNTVQLFEGKINSAVYIAALTNLK